MGLHGKGLWGQSSANQKGSKRVKCPICGKIEVPGSWNHTHPIKHDESGKPYIVLCPKQCPKCKMMNYHDLQCPDCGFDHLAEMG